MTDPLPYTASLMHHHGRRFVKNPAAGLLPVLVFFFLTGYQTFISASYVHGAPGASVNLTAEEQNWLKNNPEKLTLYFNVEFPPIEFSSASGEFTGMGADIIECVEKRLNATFVKTPSTDWNKHLSALESGECAIAPTIVATTERRRFAFFTKPYATVPVVIIVNKDVRENLTLDMLAGRTVAVVSGFATETYLRDKARGLFDVIPASNVVDGLRRTSFRQVDAFVENLAVAAYHIEQEGLPNLRVAGSTDYVFSWSIGVSRRYPLLFSAILKALSDVPLRDIEIIRKKWIALDTESLLDPETVRFLTWAGVFGLLLLLGFMAITVLLKSRLNEKVASLKASQQDFLEQAAVLRLATEVTQAGAWDYRSETRTTHLSGPWFSMLGYEQMDQAVPMTEFMMFVHPDDQPAMTHMFHIYLAGGGQGSLEHEFRLRKADGTWCWVLSKGKTIQWDETGKPSRIIGLDVSIHTLKENMELLRATLNATPDGILAVNKDLKITQTNEQFYRMWHIPPELRNIEDEGVLRSFVLDQLTDPEDFKALTELLYNSRIQHMREIGFKDGRVFECYSAPMIMGGLEIGRVWNFRDITERERLQSQLNQSKKLEAVGILAGGVAHDFNNILSVIMGYTEMTLSDMDEKNPFRPNMERILDAARRSGNLTRQLLTFARKQALAPTVFDVNESVEATLKMVRRIIGENIELAWRPISERCLVKMDPTQFDQVLINLCVNARDAISDVGHICIETEKIFYDEAYCTAHPDFSPGPYIILRVSDDGSGIDHETLTHIFEPFYTTKGVGQGTGMGLATVYGIVTQSEGVIQAFSEPGQGTMFRISIPESSTEETNDMGNEEVFIPRSQGETLLVVEDDPSLLDLARKILEQLGYTVITSGTPHEAIRIMEEADIPIDLFITDVIMPEMNGKELADRLQILRPGIAHLFMSGYTSNLITPKGVSDDGVNFIQKPFSLKDMAHKVRAVLDGE